jgi:hypothetical protein
MMILCRAADKQNVAVKVAKQTDSHLLLCGLTEENILEYMSSYLAVPAEMVPQKLRMFVAKVTLGNPLHIRETIEQLRQNHIQIDWGANKQPRRLTCQDIEMSHVSQWQHTSMVGDTVCLLESLDPLEAAVLKMSTCFTAEFTLPDLAASLCSRWADATHFDLLRLLKAITKLVQRNIIEAVPEANVTMPTRPSPNGAEAGVFDLASPRTGERPFGHTQFFRTQHLLIRAVGSAMVLEAQKKAVKRQALIERVLHRDLPGRMEALASKQKAQHIPWYYEQAFRRM